MIWLNSMMIALLIYSHSPSQISGDAIEELIRRIAVVIVLRVSATIYPGYCYCDINQD